MLKNILKTKSTHYKYTKNLQMDFVIWVSMIDLQKRLDLHNLCHSSTKKSNKSILLKIKLKKINEK